MPSPDLEALKTYTVRALDFNTVTTDQGSYLAAGGHQFRSMWTRDFCFAVPGLLAAGQFYVARHHLQRLLDSANEEGLIPRILDSIPSAARVVFNTFLGQRFKAFQLPIREPLKPEYFGEHKTLSIDSNALVTIMAWHYVQSSQDTGWLDENREKLIKVMEFYKTRMTRDGLIAQSAYEDWQDSVSRIGNTAFVNALFWIARSKLSEMGVLEFAEEAEFAALYKRMFFDPASGLIKSHSDLSLISLDAPLLLLDYGLAQHIVDPQELYTKLKSSELWKMAEIPGVCSDGPYPKKWVSWTTKAVGLHEYHGRMFWSWLSGLAAKVAYKMGDTDECDRILVKLQEMARRDETVCEIYNISDLKPFKGFRYSSERPFSWGAGKVLEAIEVREGEKFKVPCG